MTDDVTNGDWGIDLTVSSRTQANHDLNKAMSRAVDHAAMRLQLQGVPTPLLRAELARRTKTNAQRHASRRRQRP